MALFGQSGCIRTKMVVFGQKLLFSDKSDCVFGQGLFYSFEKVVFFGKSGCIRAKCLY